MIKRLIKHGNSKAIVIDEAILAVAGLDEDTLFSITVNPNGGIVIQSVNPISDSTHEQNVKDIINENLNLLKRLAGK